MYLTYVIKTIVLLEKLSQKQRHYLKTRMSWWGSGVVMKVPQKFTLQYSHARTAAFKCEFPSYLNLKKSWGEEKAPGRPLLKCFSTWRGLVKKVGD